MKSLAVAFLLLGISLSAGAAEREQVCAKYAANYGWSKGYDVQATIYSGDELNARTGTFKYRGFSTYVVIFWQEGQASIIQMDHSFLGFADSPGQDQEGRRWAISTGNTFCH